MLNEIEGYVTVPRNIPQETREQQLEEISSRYNGVSYDSTRKYYVAGIKLKRKSYSLGNHQDELECAKLYNQQALYFNNHEGGKFGLNEIEGYVTVEKNIYEDLQASKKAKKSSEYYGVTLNKVTNKYKALLVYKQKANSPRVVYHRTRSSKSIQFEGK